jgi:thiamine kinase-like enzyme
MQNIIRVTEHIRDKLLKMGYSDVNRRVLRLIKSADGENFCIDEDGNYWRGYFFISGARTYDVMENTHQAQQAAKAFGEFQNLLVDLPGEPLHETIPDFHNGRKRFRDFQKALNADVQNRAVHAKPEIEFLQSRAWVFDILPSLVEKGKLQLRTTHNDTKINNVMIDDKTHKGICVIDLDTVMPGLSLYDFGDIFRTSASRSEEDEKDLSKVYLRKERVEAILRGYLSSAGEFLNKTEKQHLIFSGKMFTLMIGTRFLTDYLEGDTYFKTHRNGHNLDRCRTQFKLVSSVEQNQEQLNGLIDKFC